MKPIKIYGEAKTGTTYLEQLLRKNSDREVLNCSAGAPLGWKHGFPQSGDADYIFIFRNIFETIKSILADNVDGRFAGLTKGYRSESAPALVNYHQWDNIIECRKAKYYSYLGFASLHGGTLVNYTYLRENPTCLTDFISQPIQDITTHTYKNIRSRDNPDRRDLTCSEKDFIVKKMDPKLEQFIDTLEVKKCNIVA